MSEADDPVEQAVARYLEHAELGGPAPDLGHLTPEDRRKLDEIIGMLDLTEGVALRTAVPEGEGSVAGRRSCSARQLAEASTSETERRLLDELDGWLPPGAPVDPDAAPSGFALPNLPVTASWTVGTPGGRVRVWLVGLETAAELEKDVSHLESLDRVFRAFPETAAICLTCRDHTALLLEPQDCAPVIEVPAGGVSARRYRRPIQPVGEALSTFIRELVPVWEALPRFEANRAEAIDVGAIAELAAAASIDLQRSAGARARYPKKEVLSSLGAREAGALTEMAISLYQGSRSPDEVAQQLRSLAGAP
jgi:hypothetical protein